MTAKQPSRQNQDVRPDRAPFFRFFADDWIAGTVLLSFEEKGFYIDLLAAMWSRRGPIPYEQVPLALRCDPRMAKRLLGRLIDAGKVTLDAANRVYNSKLMGQFSTACEGALPVELPADLSPDFYPEVTPEIAEKSGNIFPEKRTKSTEPRARDRDHIHIHSQKEEKDTKPARTDSVAASEPEIGGLNGSTAAIVNGVARWLNNLMPDLETARRIVTTNTGIFGSDAVRRAFADMQADVLDGKIIGSPIKAFAGYCDNAKKHRQQAPKGRDFEAERKARVDDVLAKARAISQARGGFQ